MSYKWKPSASARRAFAERMKDPDEQQAYNDRKAARADKRRAGSKFDYDSAGGNYVPTKYQYDIAVTMTISGNMNPAQSEAATMVMYGYATQEKVHHDHIHIVNEYARSKG